MSQDPDLPEPAHAKADSMLSRKFGKEVANYFSGSPLNRLSFLRTDHKFLSAALNHPTTSFLLLNDLAPLAHSQTKLAYVPYADVSPILSPFAPYSAPESDLVTSYNSTTTVPQLIFLGIDEQQQQQQSSGDSSTHTAFKWTNYTGAPYFALDITPPPDSSPFARACTTLIASKTDCGLTFLTGRTHMTLPAPEAALYAIARSLADWNARNPFCAGCGLRTLSVNAGFKRTCPPADSALSSPSRPPCPTRGRAVSNLSFPRTDPTIIVGVLSADEQRLLLGRQASWPTRWYSALAGFVEPGESVEEAVRREVWEESGVRLGRVALHSSQPWPYPASLMLGAIAQAVEGGETIDLGLDPELQDAKWWAVEEVREALRVGTGRLDEVEKAPTEGDVGKEATLRLPPKTAIANRLLEAVVWGWAGELKL